MTTARSIARARRRRRLTRAELAKLVGVTRQAVYDWETGKGIRLGNLKKVARVTKTPLAKLVGGAA